MYLDQQMNNLRQNVGSVIENFDAIAVSVLGALSLFYYLRLLFIASDKGAAWTLFVALIPFVGACSLNIAFPKKVKKNCFWHILYLVFTIGYLFFAFY